MKRAIIAYVPVLHRGYLDFFKKQNGVSVAYLLSDDITRELAGKFPELSYIARKDALRAVPNKEMQRALLALGVGYYVYTLEKTFGSWKQLETATETYDEIIMPDEDIMRRFS